MEHKPSIHPEFCLFFNQVSLYQVCTQNMQYNHNVYTDSVREWLICS